MTEDLRSAAKKIQEKGRAGDTVLAHISPHEAEILKMMGGYGSTNPETGLPEYKKFWKNITAKNIVAAAPIIIAVAVPGIGIAIGEAVAIAVGATVTAAEAAAIGSAVVGGATTAAQGGKVSDILQSAATAGLTSTVASGVGQELASQGVSQAVQGAASGAAGGATSAAMQGKDPLQAALTGGLVGGATGAYRDVTTQPSGTGITPGAAGETGLTVPQGFDPSQLGVSADTTGSTYLGSGINFNTPSSTTSASTFKPTEVEKLGETGVKILASEAAKSLVGGETKPRDTSALSSTGLFQPTSIVPTAATGIAPTERGGAPILGDSDEEEKSGAWGRKTLKG